MGANATQAQAVGLFFIAFVLIAAGLAADISGLYLLVGLALLAGAIMLFLKCKPWEQTEE